MIGSTGALYFMEKDKIKELEQEIETHIKLNKQLLEDIDRAGKEIERLNNIIKEVRECIEPIVELDNDIMLKGRVLKPVLEMLDKVDKEK